MKVDRSGFRWVGSYYAYCVTWPIILVLTSPLWLLGRLITGREIISGKRRVFKYVFTVANGRGVNSPPYGMKVIIRARSRGDAITKAAAIGQHYHMMLTAPF